MIRLLIIAVLAWMLFTREEPRPCVTDLPPSILSDGGGVPTTDLTVAPNHEIQSCRPVGSAGVQWICMYYAERTGHSYPVLCGVKDCDVLQ